MRKILLFAAAVALLQCNVFAQKAKTVPEKDVKVNYVKDFQRQVKDATDITWYQLDSLTYKVDFYDNEHSHQAMLFSNKGSETHYYVDKQFYPAAIKDTVAHLYSDYKIEDVWVRKVRGKMTYQASVVKMGGFLWWRKVKDSKTLNWEVDGKYINAE